MASLYEYQKLKVERAQFIYVKSKKRMEQARIFVTYWLAWERAKIAKERYEIELEKLQELEALFARWV